MKKPTRRQFIGAGAVAGAGIGAALLWPRSGAAVLAAQVSHKAYAAPPDPVLAWLETTKAAIDQFPSPLLPTPLQAPRSAVWATAWLAADRAVATGPAQSGPLAPVAFATALHDVLVAKVPAYAGELDIALAATLADVPAALANGNAVAVATATGQAAAKAVLAERADDGLSVAAMDVPYTPPVGPGYWTTTAAGKTAIQTGLGAARPFLLNSGGQFPVPPPPAPGTSRYRVDLAEVKAYGAKYGSARTAEQTAVALFWSQSSLGAFTQLLRGATAQLASQGASIATRVHLVAVFHEATTDAQIAVFNAKYIYNRWRPLTAIREADIYGNPLPDGDPLTVPDPTWEPLIPTPIHPEYPGAHSTYAGAAQAVLDALVGPPATPLTVPGPGGATRTYTDWATAVQENVDGRVWAGVHFRISDEIGAQLGRDVAGYGLTKVI